MKNEIRKTLLDIVQIFSSNDEYSWAKKFEKLDSGLDDDYVSSLRTMEALYGGMGSFNDVVLHKDGVALVMENDQLDALRHKLYQQLQEVKLR